MKTITRFIAGPGRTNTTILGRIISESRNNVVFTETNILRRLFEFKGIIIWKSLFNEFTLVNKTCADMFRENAWWEINSLRKSIWDSTVINMNPYEMRNQIISLEQDIYKKINSYTNSSDIVDEYIGTIISYVASEKKIIFKQPGIEIDLAKIITIDKEIANDWKIVFTVRNLYEIASSWLRDQMTIGQDFHDSLDILEQRIIRSCLAIKQMPSSSIFVVHHEELYEHTEKIIRQITDFLNVDFVPNSVQLYDPNKRISFDAKNDPVVIRYKNRLDSLRNQANTIMNTDLW